MSNVDTIEDMESEGNKIVVVVIGIVVALVVGMWIFSPMEVVVTGVGKVSVPATAASFNVTVVSAKDSANESLTDVRERVKRVREVLGEMGVRSTEISESQVTITPAAAIAAGAKGYQATITMNVKSLNVAKIGEIVVNMYASGAVVVSQPIVTVEDASKLEQEAINEAMENARVNLKNTVGFKPFKKIIAIEQASSGESATSTKVGEDNQGAFEIVKAVSVKYRVW